MSKPRDEEDLLVRLIQAFQNARIEAGYYGVNPYILNETAQSYLFRIIDYMNPEIWDDASTQAISKEVILALFQCAARLYESGTHAREAMDLIESEDTRAILSLGIQDSLAHVIHQRCLESINSKKSVATSAENCSQQAGLYSAIRKNKARQLNQQAMIIEHISSLSSIHSTVLQNTFDSPKVDEQFMFSNYVTLSKAFSHYEKSWLIALFPDIFQWNTLENELTSPPLNNSVAISDELKDRINSGLYEDVQEALDFMDSSKPPFTINDTDVQHWLDKSTPKEANDMWSICCTWRNLHQYSDSGFSQANKALRVERWMELVRQRALTHRNFASAEAVTAILNAADGLHDKDIHQNMSFSEASENEGDYNYDTAPKPKMPSPIDDISDLDLNLAESDDSSECIFPLSPCTHNDDFDNGTMSTLSRNDTSAPGGEPIDCTTSAKGIQPGFIVTCPSSSSLEIAGNDRQQKTQRFLRYGRASYQKKRNRSRDNPRRISGAVIREER